MLSRRRFLQVGGLSLLGAMGARALRGATPSAKPLRIVQIGVAHSHAAGKWSALQNYPEIFNCAGIWEPDDALRARAATQHAYSGVRWLTEAEVFGDAGLQAALVETELPDMLRLGRRCLDAGWHLHLEKPAGADYAGLVALQDRAAVGHLVLQPGYMFRYHPALTFCFDLVARGILGEVVAVQGDIGKVVSAAERPWLGEHYGGSMMLLGSHLLDLAVRLMGKPDRTTSFIRKSLLTPDRFSDQEMLVMQYPRGLATVRSFLSESGGELRRQLVVYGEKGTVEILPLEPAHVRLALNVAAWGFKSGYQNVTLPAPAGRYDDMLLDFARMAGGQPSSLSGFGAAHDRLVQGILLEARTEGTRT